MAVLKIAPDDADAIACQCGSLIQLGEIDRALNILEKVDKQTHILERAYCLYRLKRYPEALKLLEDFPNPKPARIVELEAQVVRIIFVDFCYHKVMSHAR